MQGKSGDAARSQAVHDGTSEALITATRRLLGYLETWGDGRGRYLGLVVHRGNLKRAGDLHDTPWSQTPIILALLELSSSQSSGIRQSLLDAVRAQCGNILANGSFAFAGHEDDRFSSLVHNALANIALFRFAAHSPGLGEDPEWDTLRVRAQNVALRNVEYLVSTLWSSDHRAFVFDRIDHYTGSDEHLVANMNAMMAESLACASSALGGSRSFDPYFEGIVAYLERLIDQPGGVIVPYSNLQADVEIAIYTALVARGLLGVLREGRSGRQLSPVIAEAEPRLKALIAVCERALDALRCPDSRNYFHGRRSGSLVKLPLFLAGSGLITHVLRLARESRGDQAALCTARSDLALLVSAWQRCTGGVSNFHGYNSRDNYRWADGGVVWEDTLPTPGWNGFLLEALAGVLDQQERTQVGKSRSRACSLDVSFSPRHLWLESRRGLVVLSWWPLKSVALYIVKKGRRLPLLWIDLRRVRRLFQPSYFCN